MIDKFLKIMGIIFIWLLWFLFTMYLKFACTPYGGGEFPY